MNAMVFSSILQYSEVGEGQICPIKAETYLKKPVRKGRGTGGELKQHEKRLILSDHERKPSMTRSK